MPCAYCGVLLTTLPSRESRRRPDNFATMDHVWPKSRFVQARRFGRTGRPALEPCCQKCNVEKADMTIDEWLAKIPDEDPRRPLILRVRERFSIPPPTKRRVKDDARDDQVADEVPGPS